MKPLNHCLAFTLIPLALTLSACSDSGGGDGGSTNVSSVDLSFSDAAVDGAKKVVLTVERITFRRGGDDDAEDVVVDFFVDDGSDVTKENDEFQINLMDFQGEKKQLLIDAVELPVGEYSNMLIDVVDEDTKYSYVLLESKDDLDALEDDPEQKKELKVPSETLKLGGFTITPTSAQSLVVEFGLQQSMTYNPGPDRYILKPRGIRIVSVEEAALVTGTIDHAALALKDTTCAVDETDGIPSTPGNVYLFSSPLAADEMLGDNYDPDIVSEETGYAVPIASSALEAGTYSLSYLEPGNYTLAVSCQGAPDDADRLETTLITVPYPADQTTTFRLDKGQTLNCNLPLIDNGCGAEPEAPETAE